MASASPRLAAVLGVASCLTLAAGCSEPTPSVRQDPRPVSLAVTVVDDEGDVGGSKTFAGTYPPADIVEFGYGAGEGDLVVRWTMSSMLEETGEETASFGFDSRTPGQQETLFSVRVSGDLTSITDGAGFSHPCSSASVTTDRAAAQVTSRMPLACLGSPDELTLTGSASVHLGATGDRIVAFDIAAGSETLETAGNTVTEHSPSPEDDAKRAAPTGDPDPGQDDAADKTDEKEKS